MNNIQLGFSLLQFHIYTVLCVLQPVRTSKVSSFRFRDLRGYICFQKRNSNTRARIKEAKFSDKSSNAIFYKTLKYET